MPTIGEMKRQHADAVMKAAERSNIGVGSVYTQWPMCSMAAFLDACGRLEEQRKLIGKMVRELREHRYCGDAYPENGWPSVNKLLAEYAQYKRSVVGKKV